MDLFSEAYKREISLSLLGIVVSTQNQSPVSLV